MLLRLPRDLHALVARRARRDAVSINAFVTATLARSLGQGDVLDVLDELVRERAGQIAKAG